ncbi:FAD/NAD(P)-binding domain-containing protein [Whalleya microplaca]|nr:FAD/NAD(P)-binding domain-containing protein [Whalleya microplaca]
MSSSQEPYSKSEAFDIETFDVVIIGAGISGINCAYRLQTEHPRVSFVILDSRDGLGGTWAQFTYPGVRSDSDMNGLGFAWHPWTSPRPFADGAQILEYLKDAARKYNITERIRIRHRVSSADWSSKSQQWALTIDHEGEQKHLRASWMILGTGYFDHQTPLQTKIPGLENFQGKVIHPQFWPNDYDYENKKIAVIGSGATSVTLVPRLATKAAQVTMIQRSPTYIRAMDNTSWVHKHLPGPLASACRRLTYTIRMHLAVIFCHYFPDAAREFLRKATIERLPKWVDQDPHFKPRYNPWDQRMCLDSDGRFYESLHRPNVKIITGNIENITDSEVQMRDGETVDADVIVPATGFIMKLGGDIDINVDGERVSWSKRLIWNGAMLEEVPNMIFMIGYTNNSWTLRVDNVAMILVRLLQYMAGHALKSAVPEAPKEAAAETEHLWQLNSTYAMLAEDRLPVYGKTGPWKPMTSPFLDYFRARWGDYTSGLHFSL